MDLYLVLSKIFKLKFTFALILLILIWINISYFFSYESSDMFYNTKVYNSNVLKPDTYDEIIDKYLKNPLFLNSSTNFIERALEAEKYQQSKIIFKNIATSDDMQEYAKYIVKKYDIKTYQDQKTIQIAKEIELYYSKAAVAQMSNLDKLQMALEDDYSRYEKKINSQNSRGYFGMILFFIVLILLIVGNSKLLIPGLIVLVPSALISIVSPSYLNMSVDNIKIAWMVFLFLSFLWFPNLFIIEYYFKHRKLAERRLLLYQIPVLVFHFLWIFIMGIEENYSLILFPFTLGLSYLLIVISYIVLKYKQRYE